MKPGRRHGRVNRALKSTTNGRELSRENLQLAKALPTVGLGDPRHALGAHGDESAGLTKHQFCRGRRDLPTEQTKPPSLQIIAIGPFGKFIGRRRVADVGGTATHDKPEHHL
jgi:hypothetical protein